MNKKDSQLAEQIVACRQELERLQHGKFNIGELQTLERAVKRLERAIERRTKLNK